MHQCNCARPEASTPAGKSSKKLNKRAPMLTPPPELLLQNRKTGSETLKQDLSLLLEKNRFRPDGVHPNIMGCRLLGANLRHALGMPFINKISIKAVHIEDPLT
ncbi:hypothetical protein DPEC_G00183660 [Dallia pectoralis]|uniref:Uncharacterized protein n=1 Tax=Dallia pectoralis TaxID=75939 RepID=A0ACC2GBA6_DALPE|nr:hypothetical protein DPEC_G00183660 [Dallia pectoralis]